MYIARVGCISSVSECNRVCGDGGTPILPKKSRNISNLPPPKSPPKLLILQYFFHVVFAPHLRDNSLVD